MLITKIVGDSIYVGHSLEEAKRCEKIRAPQLVRVYAPTP